jgi:hypothetical protein
MSPAPTKILQQLLEQGLISEQQAKLAETVPMADDITVEGDSGGHTDNRPIVALLPTILQLRHEIQEKYRYETPIRVGAAGGIGTPHSVLAAFMMGAAYVVTGSVNQACVEAGTSAQVKQLLAQASITDMAMAPAADMFEMGVRLQVLKRGSFFPIRAQKLFAYYQKYEAIEEIPSNERQQLEQQIFRKDLDTVWQETVAYFQQRDPDQIARSIDHPKRKMALIFRSYLGQASRWAITGDESRKRTIKSGVVRRWGPLILGKRHLSGTARESSSCRCGNSLDAGSRNSIPLANAEISGVRTGTSLLPVFTRTLLEGCPMNRGVECPFPSSVLQRLLQLHQDINQLQTQIEQGIGHQSMQPEQSSEMEVLSTKMNQTPIAIVGMASLFPQSKDLQAYWTNIVQKADCITDVPASRWNIDDYYDPDPTAPDKTYCKRGGFLPDIDFNPMEFGLPPNILEVTDIAQILSLVVAKQALKDAGCDQATEAVRDRIGVILGVGGGQKLITPLTARLQSPILEKVLISSGLSQEETQPS